MKTRKRGQAVWPSLVDRGVETKKMPRYPDKGMGKHPKNEWKGAFVCSEHVTPPRAVVEYLFSAVEAPGADARRK